MAVSVMAPAFSISLRRPKQLDLHRSESPLLGRNVPAPVITIESETRGRSNEERPPSASEPTALSAPSELDAGANNNSTNAAPRTVPRLTDITNSPPSKALFSLLSASEGAQVVVLRAKVAHGCERATQPDDGDVWVRRSALVSEEPRVTATRIPPTLQSLRSTSVRRKPRRGEQHMALPQQTAPRSPRCIPVPAR